MIVDPARRCAAWEAGKIYAPQRLAWFWIVAWLPRGTWTHHHHGGDVRA